MRERVTVVTLSVCVSLFFILEKVLFSELKLTSVHSCSSFGEKASGISAVDL